MYRNSEEVLDKLISGEIKLSSVSKNMNRHFHKRNIEQWMLFAKAKTLYKMWLLDEEDKNEIG